MRHVALAIGVVLAMGCAAMADAQEVLLVPYDRATIAWSAPKYGPDTPTEQLPSGVGPTKWHILNCGTEDVKVDMPSLSVPVKTVSKAPGQYQCTLWAANEFGRSDPSLVPKFHAGNVPATSENVRIEVR